MSEETQYANRPSDRIRSHGGSVRVTCSSNVGQGAGGTSTPCAGCWVSPAIGNTEVVKMNIDAAASAILGIDLQQQFISGTTASGASIPLWVPIDGVDKLYFYSADANAIIDITYFTGQNIKWAYNLWIAVQGRAVGEAAPHFHFAIIDKENVLYLKG